MQFIAPDGNLPPLPGRVHNLLERSMATPVLKGIPGRPVPDDYYRFSIILAQDFAQKSPHSLHDHQQAFSVREWLCDAPREFCLYLGNWILRHVPVIVLAEPGVWHKRQISACEGDLSGGRCAQ